MFKIITFLYAIMFKIIAFFIKKTIILNIIHKESYNLKHYSFLYAIMFNIIHKEIFKILKLIFM